MASMNVSVPDPMRDWVEQRIASGQYASVSDYERDLIHRDQPQADVHHTLVAALIEGESSGISKRRIPKILPAVKAETALPPERSEETRRAKRPPRLSNGPSPSRQGKLNRMSIASNGIQIGARFGRVERPVVSAYAGSRVQLESWTMISVKETGKGRRNGSRASSVNVLRS